MLKAQIEQQVKEALKKGDACRLQTLRFLLAALQNEEIAKQKEISEEDFLAVVQRQIKQHRESIEAYQKGGREDLAHKEEEELKILNTFLPQQLSVEEIKKVVAEVRKELSDEDKNNFGKVMGQVMARVKGKTDGNTVGSIVKELLG